jgi:hypothetical protein
VLTFAYNCQVHSSTGTSPFELVLSRQTAVSSIVYDFREEFALGLDQVRKGRTVSNAAMHIAVLGGRLAIADQVDDRNRHQHGQATSADHPGPSSATATKIRFRMTLDRVLARAEHGIKVAGRRYHGYAQRRRRRDDVQFRPGDRVVLRREVRASKLSSSTSQPHVVLHYMNSVLKVRNPEGTISNVSPEREGARCLRRRQR